MPDKQFFKDFTGVTASIETHRDGTATLRVSAGGKIYLSHHKNAKAARSAWYRWCR